MDIEIICQLILGKDNFPNNSNLPFLIYKSVFKSTKKIKEVFKNNDWKNLWTDGIYDYHHYHSNTHEALGILAGDCEIEMGGENGVFFKLSAGDAVIIPAGVSHKKQSCSDDFKCIGAYPFAVEYDMNYGKPSELLAAKKKISQVPLPFTDPVYGKNGPLFNYWKKRC